MLPDCSVPGKRLALSPPSDSLDNNVDPEYLQRTSPAKLPLQSTHPQQKPVITPSRNLLTNGGMLLTNGTFRPSPLLYSPLQAYPQIHQHLPAGNFNSSSFVDSLHHASADAVGDEEASEIDNVSQSVSRKEARLNAELGFWERNGQRPRTWDKVAHAKPKA